jgi:AcrR family transcriptional regulator
LNSLAQYQKSSDMQKRRYLPSSERKEEILKAAFEEFSSRGFLATSLERIANRAGLSKSGIYAHYKSKHDVFEDVLLTTLLPADSRIPDLDTQCVENLPQLLDLYLDRRYMSLSTQKAIAAFRLLIVESGRTPELVRRCIQKLVERSLTGDSNFIQACIKRQLVRVNIDTDAYLLSNAPAALWVMLLTLYGEKASPVPLAQVKALHKKLLMELLQPDARPAIPVA